MNAGTKIPVCEPFLSDEDIAAVSTCLREGWVSSTGPYVEEFERRWAAVCEQKYGVAVANGTVALEIACEAIGLRAGDEVILPSFTIISCAQAITKCGAVPVVVDAEPLSWQIDPSLIERKITPRTKAIMVVHMYGHPSDMDPILALAKKYNLRIIEDAAEVHGARYKGRMCGSFGDVTTFSFFANKLITTGEGGMILTSNEEFARRAKKKRNLCFEEQRRFLHNEIGSNARLTNMQAALGLSQMARLSDTIAAKNRIAATYRSSLAREPKLRFQHTADWASPVSWVVGIVLSRSAGMNAAACMKKLAEFGIETRPFFLGMHQQPALHTLGFARNESCPVTEELAEFGFYVPNGVRVTDSQIGFVCDTIRSLLAGSV